MRRLVVVVFVLAAACAVLAFGCMDREPAPVCPVPTEVNNAESLIAGFDGVDLLVVVDNSGSMLEEQAILATGFFTLINSLVKPTSDWEYPPVTNMRVAVVSSDMGLQYGDGQTDDLPNVQSCGNTGDDGEFQTILGSVSGVYVGSGQIACEKGGDQCPEDFICNAKGLCEASEDPYFVNCPSSPSGGEDYAETADTAPNSYLATEVSCMSSLGADGCGIEQQIQAAARALERDGQGQEVLDEDNNVIQSGFLKLSHLLAVLVVSDEEDCSVEDRGLYETDEWNSGPQYDGSDPSTGHLNTACNYPEENGTNYLYDPDVYYDAFISHKDNFPGAVIFAAIAGVPVGDDSPCQGRGDQITGCLSSPDMQYVEDLFYYPGGTVQYWGFVPACERVEDGVDVTTARPGRRYVELAEKFGRNAYMYSICNADWGPAMESIAEVIAAAIGAQCYGGSLEWAREEVEGCPDCGAAKCDMIAVLDADEGEEEFKECPNGLEEIGTEVVNGVWKTECRVPKIPTPLYCDSVEDYIDHNEPGWYYCENTNNENFNEACDPGENVDNDEDGLVDCDDPDCNDCQVCGGLGGGTCENSCMYAVEMTSAATELTRLLPIKIQCLSQFNFEDANCQENSNAACTNALDDDGNGVWDCTTEEDHFADPNCCPLEVTGDTCSPASSYSDICPGVPVLDNNPNTETVCEIAARVMGCTLSAN